MNLLVNQLKIEEKDVDFFQKNGFIDTQARYSKTFLEGLARSRQSFDKPLQTLFGYKFSNLEDGETNSPYL